jgi:hypothetical protein
MLKNVIWLFWSVAHALALCSLHMPTVACSCPQLPKHAKTWSFLCLSATISSLSSTSSSLLEIFHKMMIHRSPHTVHSLSTVCCPQLPTVALSCPQLSTIAHSCPQLPTVAHNCPKLPTLVHTSTFLWLWLDAGSYSWSSSSWSIILQRLLKILILSLFWSVVHVLALCGLHIHSFSQLPTVAPSYVEICYLTFLISGACPCSQ